MPRISTCTDTITDDTNFPTKDDKYPLQGPFSCNCAKVLISSQVVHKYIYILRLWGMLRECTLGSSRVLRFCQYKIYKYNTCSCCTS